MRLFHSVSIRRLLLLAVMPLALPIGAGWVTALPAQNPFWVTTLYHNLST